MVEFLKAALAIASFVPKRPRHPVIAVGEMPPDNSGLITLVPKRAQLTRCPMRTMLRLLAFFNLLLAFPYSGVADDAASRATVEKAIEAHGGEKLLAKFSAATSKIKGTVYIQDIPVPFSGEIAMQSHDQQKAVISFVADGQSISLISVLNREQGWIKINDETVEMPKEQLTETKESAYSAWVATLVPLRQKEFMLAPFGVLEIAGRKAVGVNVTHEGRRPINLFFDKETSRLVRSEARVRDETTGEEVTEQVTYSEYKAVEGVQHPMKVVIKRNEKPHAEIDVEEVKLAEKLDDSVFARP